MRKTTMAGLLVLAAAARPGLCRGKAVPVEWVSIPGGAFSMGTEGDVVKEVALKTFEMSKTVVTVEQYGECVAQHQCAEPGAGGKCNWKKTGRELHPINCVSWYQAKQYAESQGARLPSESEWEYAARSGGKSDQYPWGKEDATCDKAVMSGYDADRCSNGGTLPACSRPAGNTAQGLCDMAGNVWEWTLDTYQRSYAGTPTDGSAFHTYGAYQVVRGGSFRVYDSSYLRAACRHYRFIDGQFEDVGFRLVRERPSNLLKSVL